MEYILKMSNYVGAIINAHNSKDIESERQLANDAEFHFDLYAIPDYDSETGQAVASLSYKAALDTETRPDLDGGVKAEETILRMIKRTQDLKDQAEAYLKQTEGQNAHEAPGRAYMVRCADAAEGTLEYLKQLADITERENNAPLQCIGKEALFIRKRDVRRSEFAEVIRQLLVNGILYKTEYDSDDKLQAIFKSFLIGAGEHEVKVFPTTYRMTVNEPKRFLCFVSFLYDNVKDIAPGQIKKGNKWAIVKDWFQNSEGETYTQDSLNTLASQGRTQYLSDGSIKEIAIKVANILADN
ncbi:MAG: hypothetical protein J5953_03775 [Prevotella sp.]|nr:hypothetical protein [Prevotella sp.]MBO5630327.1 hypothetical protein [Aeriscardovia sp.]